MLRRDIENINKMKSTTFEIKNTLDKFNSRLDTVEAKISELEDTTAETTQKRNTNGKKDWKNGTEQSVNCRKTSKGIVCMQCKSSREKKGRQKTIFEEIISDFQINKNQKSHRSKKLNEPQ